MRRSPLVATHTQLSAPSPASISPRTVPARSWPTHGPQQQPQQQAAPCPDRGQHQHPPSLHHPILSPRATTKPAEEHGHTPTHVYSHTPMASPRTRSLVANALYTHHHTQPSLVANEGTHYHSTQHTCVAQVRLYRAMPRALHDALATQRVASEHAIARYGARVASPLST